MTGDGGTAPDPAGAPGSSPSSSIPDRPLDLVIRGRALVDGVFRTAEIGVAGGVIVAIGPAETAVPNAEAAETVTLADDEVLLPGLVDTHVHVDEPGRTEWEGFASATAAAAAGGVTTLLDMPLNSIPATVSVEALETKRAAARDRCVVDVGFWGGAVPENLGRLNELWDAGVFGFKCFLTPSGVDEFGHLDTAQLFSALEEIAGFDGLLIAHAEDPAVLDAHPYAGGRDFAGFAASRPPEAEVAAIEHVIEGVRRTGARAHIVHLASAAALPALRAARAEGLPITAETCPHYLAFTGGDVPEGGTHFKCAPPIRDAANRDALWQALLDGDLGMIVSDHSPSTRELKFAGGGDFGLAWGGIAGLQLGLRAVWTEAAERGIGLERLVEWMSAGPARFAGLGDRGALALGRRADLTVFAPDARATVHAEELAHRNKVSAYDGVELRGAVRRTWVAGRAPSAEAANLLVRPGT
ncbi:MAG: allantoinase AllB [Actinomycetales bacterium]|nr:allantoinase AllB [Actinomycetales bacterium]